MPSSDPAAITRDPGLDAFRGLTVVLMILVNLQGSGEVAFAQFRHAEWHGMTVADLVFPWFLFIVGLSLPLALDGRDVPFTRIARRALVIFVLGVLLALAIRPTLDPQAIRWTGVLQRIAIVYMACAVLAKHWRGVRSVVLAAFGCLILHSALILLLAAPGEAAPSLAMGQGLSGWMDRTFLPGRLHRETWDPEGLLSTLPSVATGLLGVAMARWRRRGATPFVLLFSGVALMLVGFALTPLLPLNKALWTASFVAVTAGSGLLLWLALSALARSAGGLRLLSFPIFAGQTALTFYVLHMLLIALLVRTWRGETLWSRSFDLLASTGVSGALASLLFALLAGAIALAPLSWLRRRGLLLRA
jgi:predicted acyltransferase